MSLIKARELFSESSFPVTVDTLVDRTLIQNTMHRHEYFEMLYVEEGTLVNRFSSEAITMNPGDLIVMKPYASHVLEDDAEGAPLKAYCCSFQPQVVDFGINSIEELQNSGSPNRYFFKPMLPLMEETVSAVHIKVSDENREMVSALFEQLKASSHDHGQQGRAMSRCHFLNLLACLAGQEEEEAAVEPQKIEVDASLRVSRYKAGIRKTLNFIHENFDKTLTLDEMASMCGASESYFCRMFKHETGMTFLGYLNGLRVERACVLLRDSCDSALEICYNVGFNEYTHFGRLFKKITGQSPAEYRKQHPQVKHVREFAIAV
ncbi:MULTISPECIES: AraC family transcriptional regulator [unclassified Lentimonas]|uniref:AraC family transcriptional regulator n=1 Tax=unclassified Lentimonas TaxID=2630993 RepID=UPI001326DBD8|nr:MULTISPECIES: AraC family transcriptional regulator [unclassified Lentimonas]CAA6679664.1 Unannotated [Lentimonas sp. CC4]CAA6683569.1 Unannotated [Lentimonas sp. CC6]CAA6690716.1 Unannotated [Lentimonas sp. CC19]CAA6693343.1 Unannotated [Lentimonas sp. CC10]CAA7071821.1 Unannotated [Lentimonas sp. CC11]